MWNREEFEESLTMTAPRRWADPRPTPTCIGQSIVIRGDVKSSEDLTINGRVEGTIDLGGHQLTVGTGASIEAVIVAGTVIINGAVTGNVLGQDKVEVGGHGSVDGDIKTPRLAVAEGALIRGRVDTRDAELANSRDVGLADSQDAELAEDETPERFALAI